MYFRRLFTFFLFILFFSNLFPITTVYASGENWLSGWSSRKMITISSTDVGSTDLSNFPLLVKVTADSDLSTALSSGNDIRFTSSDGVTLLSYERESWAGGSGDPGTGVFWVKVPTISYTSDTIIYIYFGNASASTNWTTTTGVDADTTNCASPMTPAQCTWKEGASQNFAGVWHLKDLSSLNDSTINGNNCTNSGASANSSGKISGAVSFNGSSSYLSCGHKSSLIFTTGLTIEAWANPTTATGGWYTFLSKVDSARYYNGGWFMFFMSGKFYSYDTPSSANNISVASAPADNWTHLVSSNNNGADTLYVNGVTSGPAPGGTTSVPITNGDGLGDLLIGTDTLGDYYPGLLDEIRISSIPRLTGWVNFEYKNINSINNELTFSTATEAPTPTSDNSSSSSPSNNSPSSPSCGDSKPLSFPNLFQINTSGSTAKLFFTPIANIDNYYVSFSTKPDAEEHGTQITLAKEGVQNYTINLLKPNTVYYFKVRGQNGCMPGEWGNIMKVKTRSSGITATSPYYKNIFVNFTTTVNNFLIPKKIISLIPDQVATPTPKQQVVSTSQPIAQPQTKKSCFLFWCW